MLERLINSQTRLEIMAFLFRQPEKRYYAREIVKSLKLDPANAHKELANLVAGQFLSTEESGGKKYFLVNSQSIFFNGLKEVFAHYKTAKNPSELVCVEEMLNYYPMMTSLPWNTYLANEFLKRIGVGKRFTCLLNVFKDNLCQLIVPKQEFYAVGLNILDKVKAGPDWGRKYIAELKQAENLLYVASYKLDKLNLKKFSDRELLKVYEDYYQIYGNLHIYHWVQTALDFDDNIFSKYLMGYLKDKVRGTKYSLGDVFSVLTTPTEEATPTKEYRELLLILKDIINRPALKEYFISTETRMIVRGLPVKDKKISRRITRHTADFGWLGYGTAGPGWDEAYFIDLLSSLARQGSEPDKLLVDLDNNRRQIERRQEQLARELKIDANQVQIFQFARDLIFSKGSRKDSMFHSYSVIENLFKEIGRRRYLSLRQVRYLYPHEFKEILLGRKITAAILNERYKFSLNFSTGRFEEDLNLSGEKAAEFLASLNIIQEDISNVKILYGDCASPGRVRGEVKIINIPKDMVKMNKGDILVSFATTPDLVSAIKKAAAIITDAGGITCHAAIISRELGVPCIVGTKIATKILHDHDIIDVNATHGKVDIIKKV